MTVVEHFGPRPPIDATGVGHALLAGDWIAEAGWLSDAAFASGAGAGRGPSVSMSILGVKTPPNFGAVRPACC